MARLKELARLVRSKNAGPFQLTFDVLFDDETKYLRVKNSNVLSKQLFAEMWRLPEDKVSLYHYDAAWAIKVTVPRPVVSGSAEDTDVFGGQQYAYLVDLEIPEENLRV